MEVAVDPIDRADPHDDVARVADRDEIERAFLDLSVEHRAVLVMTHYVGLPAPEIATILGIPVGTVYSRIHNGTRQMRTSLVRTSAMPEPAPEQGR
jgi:RNA polymerase sigma factor (sigma-70 family)